MLKDELKLISPDTLESEPTISADENVEKESDAITNNPRSLSTIAVEILAHKEEIDHSFLAIGGLLIEAKKELKKKRAGSWINWLHDNVDFSERTAQRLMRLADEFTNATPVSELGCTKAYILLSLPPEEREDFIADSHEVDGEVKSVADMSKRELEEIIREKKQKSKTPPLETFKEMSMPSMTMNAKNSLTYAFESKLKSAHGCVDEMFKSLSELSDRPGTCEDLSSKLRELCEVTIRIIKQAKKHGWKVIDEGIGA